MKKIVLSLAFTAIFTSIFAQSHSDVDMAVSKFRTLYNNKQNEDIFNMLSDRIKTLMPIEQTSAAMNKLHSDYGDIKSYEYTKQENGQHFYDVEFTDNKATLIVALDDSKKLEGFRFVPYQGGEKSKSNFTYKSAEGKIHGTLLTPDGKKAVPVVLIIAGSGPTDRDGNQSMVKTDSYKLLAEALLQEGIATLRYDKRGVGESSSALKDESTLKFDDMVGDAAGIIEQLKSDKRFSSVTVLGHSEGSLIGMLAAKKSGADAFISVAGLAESADKIIVRQIAAQSEELSLKTAFILDSLNKGQDVKVADPNLQTLFRPSVQPYIKSWIKYEPKTEIGKLRVPVLILQGTTDIQVPVSEAETLKEASPSAKLTIIKGMNHVLKQAPEDREKNMATYSNPNLPLSKELTPAINTFVLTAIKK